MSDWIDLTADLDEDIPVRPLHKKPEFHDEATIEEDGYNSTLIHIETHCGTHMDAPTHFLPKEKHRSVHEWTADEMVGEGVVLDYSGKEEGSGVTKDDLQEKIEEVGLREGDFVILKFDLTPSDSDQYLMEYNHVNESAAEFLVSAGVSCVASEALNIEQSGKPVSELTVHRELLEADVFIVEGLVNLDQVEEGRCEVICTPLPYRDRDGSQVRFLIKQD